MTRDAHARTSGKTTEPLYDVNVATPSHAERARTLVAQSSTGTLASLGVDPAGYPYASFVTVAFDAGKPVLLISELAEHTKNLRIDERSSLLIAETGVGDPLAHGRVTLIGRFRPLTGTGGSAREAYLEVHPNAAFYADFKDFSFWQQEVESIRYIGGFGRMSWLAPADWLAATPDPLAASAEQIVAHMNADHAEAMADYCRAFSKATDISSATMTGVDRYGFEMSALTAEGPRPVRLAFGEPVTTSDEARQALIAMLQAARAKLSGAS